MRNAVAGTTLISIVYATIHKAAGLRFNVLFWSVILATVACLILMIVVFARRTSPGLQGFATTPRQFRYSGGDRVVSAISFLVALCLSTWMLVTKCAPDMKYELNALDQNDWKLDSTLSKDYAYGSWTVRATFEYRPPFLVSEPVELLTAGWEVYALTRLMPSAEIKTQPVYEAEPQNPVYFQDPPCVREAVAFREVNSKRLEKLVIPPGTKFEIRISTPPFAVPQVPKLHDRVGDFAARPYVRLSDPLRGVIQIACDKVLLYQGGNPHWKAPEGLRCKQKLTELDEDLSGIRSRVLGGVDDEMTWEKVKSGIDGQDVLEKSAAIRAAGGFRKRKADVLKMLSEKLSESDSIGHFSWMSCWRVAGDEWLFESLAAWLSAGERQRSAAQRAILSVFLGECAGQLSLAPPPRIRSEISVRIRSLRERLSRVSLEKQSEETTQSIRLIEDFLKHQGL